MLKQRDDENLCKNGFFIKKKIVKFAICFSIEFSDSNSWAWKERQLLRKLFQLSIKRKKWEKWVRNLPILCVKIVLTGKTGIVILLYWKISPLLLSQMDSYSPLLLLRGILFFFVCFNIMHGNLWCAEKTNFPAKL